MRLFYFEFFCKKNIFLHPAFSPQNKTREINLDIEGFIFEEVHLQISGFGIIFFSVGAQ